MLKALLERHVLLRQEPQWKGTDKHEAQPAGQTGVKPVRKGRRLQEIFEGQWSSSGVGDGEGDSKSPSKNSPLWQS